METVHIGIDRVESMTTIQIHIPSLIIGFVIGTFVVSLATCSCFFDDRWHFGFSQGFQDGIKFRKREEIEQNEIKE